MFIKTKGVPNKPSEFSVDVVGFHIMDVGSAGYTEFEYDAVELMDLYEKNPKYMECRMGMLHSHNSMPTFFSGTDVEELEDNTVETDFMVSLIVNNASKYTAKVAWRTKQKVNIETTGWFNKQAITFKELVNRESLYTVDLDIEIEGVDELTAIDARLMEIEEDKAKLAKLKADAARASKPAHTPYKPVKQLNAFNKSGYEDDGFGFQNLREMREVAEFQQPGMYEEVIPMEGETFDNFIACLLVLNQNYQGTISRAMQELKDRLKNENIPMLVEMIIDNIEDYYEQHYGELCTMETYMELCTGFVREVRGYNIEHFPIVEPLAEALYAELGES